MLGEDVLYLPIRDLATQIRSRKISPVELTQGYLDRSKRLGAEIQSLCDHHRRSRTSASSRRRKGDFRRPLSGAPSRNSVCRKGFACRERLQNHLGRKALC